MSDQYTTKFSEIFMTTMLEDFLHPAMFILGISIEDVSIVDWSLVFLKILCVKIVKMMSTKFLRENINACHLSINLV